MATNNKLAKLPPHVGEPNPDIYWSDNYVVLDFETTIASKGSPLDPSNRIVLACWQRGGVPAADSVQAEDKLQRLQIPAGGQSGRVSGPHRNPVRHHFGGEYDLGELVDAIRGADFLVAHNAKFELGWLKRCGIDLRQVVVYDTLIGEYVRGGNRYTLLMMSLAKTLKRYKLPSKKDFVGWMIKLGICPSVMPQSWLLEYCERDVTATHELFLKQREVLKERGLMHILYQRCLVTPALTDIEFNGMQLDYDMVKAAIAEQEDEYAKKTAELQAFMGGVPPSSTKQKGEYVYNVLKFKIPRDHRGREHRTESGNGSVAAPVLEKLRPVTEKQREFLRLHTEWAVLHSDVTKYLRKFELCCKEADGHLQASFNQCSSRTHRLTSSGLKFKVQLQNLNRKFKPIFKSRHKNWLMGEADGAQLEFRIATHMGRDSQGLYDISHGVDVHKFTASQLLEKEEADVKAEERQEAKEDTFKPLYGGKSGTPAQQRYYKAFAEKYGDITQTQTGWTHKVLNDKKLVTEYGLIFYWPGCKMMPSGYITHSTNIHNYPVQGFATAEIIPIALVCAWHRMKDLESFLVNTVHDSIIAELHPDEVDTWHTIAQTCLIDDCYDILTRLYNVRLTVPLGAGVTIGSHWANKEAKANEVTYSASADLYEDAAKEAGML